MAYHPLNLALRFLLELITLWSLGLWGWRADEGWLRWILVVLAPLAAAAAWGVFAVPDDPSRSGSAPVPVPGPLRLLLELCLLGLAAWALHDVGRTRWAMSFAIAVIVHYALSYERVAWLLGRSS